MENKNVQEILKTENVAGGPMPMPKPLPDEGAAAEQGMEGAQKMPVTGDKMVPLAALHKEREKIKALRQESEACGAIIKKLLEKTGAASPRELAAKMDEADFECAKHRAGGDEETAKLLLSQQEKMRNLERENKQKDAALEIERLRHNPLYSDIAEVGERVLAYASEKDLTVKEAYNALFGEARAEKIRALAKEAALKEHSLKQEKRIPALSETGNAQVKSAQAGLTPEEASWARTAGISLEDYAKYKSKN